MGQHATDIFLAIDILETLIKVINNNNMTIKNILEPACGTGAFISAIRKLIADNPNIVAVEKDKLICNYTQQLWANENVDIFNVDFLIYELEQKFDMVIANPPYTRHQHMSKEYKDILKENVKNELEYNISGYSSLYTYFILLTHKYLKQSSYSAWLIPAEFMNNNYNSILRQYLTQKVRLIRVHKYDITQSNFKDALVSSAVIIFKNEKPNCDDIVEFSSGYKISTPTSIYRKKISEISNLDKWDRIYTGLENKKEDTITLGDLFDVKRGIATGNNEFFILDENFIKENKFPMEVFKPILPSIKYISEDIIENDIDGLPKLSKRQFVIDTDLDLELIESKYPSFYKYLMNGLNSGITSGYLISKRKIWYKQETRKPPLFLCTYMARGNDKGFRFLLNKTNAIATNTYLLMYPKEKLQKIINTNSDLENEIFMQLQKIAHDEFAAEGREYGGGLKKVEPKELSKIPVNNVVKEIAKLKEVYWNL